MNTCEETYTGSKIYYLVFGDKPKADWSEFENLSLRSMSDLCVRSLDPVVGQKSNHYMTKASNTWPNLWAPSLKLRTVSMIFNKISGTTWQSIGWIPLAIFQIQGILPPKLCVCVVKKHTQFTGDMKTEQIISTNFYSKLDVWDQKNDSEAESFLLSSLSETVRKGFKPSGWSSFIIWWPLTQRLLINSMMTSGKLDHRITNVKILKR